MKRKNLFSLCVATVLCLNLCVPCFATNVSAINTTSLVETETEGIYETASGTYLMESNGEYFVMEKRKAALSSESEVSALLEDESLPKEVRDNIAEKYELLKETGEADGVTLTLYEDLGTVSNLRGVHTPVYKTYKNHEMKSIVTSWTGLNQETVKIYSGKKTYPTASTLVDIALAAGSFAKLDPKVELTLAVFGAGKTLWSAYKEINPGIQKTTASTDDFVELNFRYDFYQKFVYVYSTTLEGWQHALEAERVVVRDPYVRACFMDDSGYSGGARVLQVIGSVVPLESESYSDPWDTAYNHMFFKLIEKLDAKIGNYNFVFGDFR